MLVPRGSQVRLFVEQIETNLSGGKWNLWADADCLYFWSAEKSCFWISILIKFNLKIRRIELTSHIKLVAFSELLYQKKNSIRLG